MGRRNRPCIDCGTLAATTKGRCPTCWKQHRTRYNAAWQRISRAQIAAHPACAWCGTTRDLTCDHLEPGNLAAGVRTLCRSCNSRRSHGLGPKG